MLHMAKAPLSIALLVAVGSGCVRSVVDRPWVRVTTAHVVLETDLARELAVKRAARLEQTWLLLETVYRIFGSHRAPPAKSEVIVASDCRLLPGKPSPAAAGWVFVSRDFERRRTAVVCDEQPWGDEIFKHELAHVFNYTVFGVLPVWVNEGLATYLQAIRVERGNALIGAPATTDVRHRWRRHKRLVGLAELRALTREQWRGVRDRAQYLAAWKAIHVLANTFDDDRRRIRGFLGALVAGSDEPSAWRDHVADVEPTIVERMQNIEQEDRLAYWTVPYRAPAIAPLRVEAIAPAAAVARVLEMSMFIDDDGAAELAARLARDEATWPAARFWRAAWLANRKHPDLAAASALLRAYLAAAPDDARGWLGLVVTELRRRLPAGHLGTEPAAPPGLESLEGDVIQLMRRTTTARAFNAVAYYWLMRRRPGLAAPFIKRSLAKDPSCIPCLSAHALAEFQRGRFASAVATQRRVIAAIPEDELDDDERRLLAIFTAAAAARAP